MTTTQPPTRRITLTIDLDDNDDADNHAADALLHLISWLRHAGIPADATLHYPHKGRLRATTRPESQ